MKINALNVQEEINNFKKIENLSETITNINPKLDYEVTTFLRNGRVYYLNSEVSQSQNWNSGDILFTIPKEYLPTQNITCSVTGGENSRDVDVTISATSGNVVVGGDVSKSVWMRIYVMWIA